MKWDEVKKIENDIQGGGLVFYAADRNKRIAVVPGPGFWSGSDKQNMLKLLSEEIDKRQIELKHTPRAAYTMSKNTKVE